MKYGEDLKIETKDGILTNIYLNGKKLNGVTSFKLEQDMNSIMCATLSVLIENCDAGLDKLKIIKKPPFKMTLKIKEFLERFRI